jgi:hypothetical protein
VALLTELGHTVHILSFSGHKYLLNQYETIAVSDDSIKLADIQCISPIINIEDIYHISRQYDTALISFPPSFYRFFDNIPFKYPLLLNCGHRLHIHNNQPSLFLDKLRNDVLSNKVKLCTMSTYDREYIKHYTNLHATELPVTCFHLPHLSYTPIKEEILIGPAHAHQLAPFSSIDNMNSYGSKYNIVFAKIKDLYPNYSYSDLVNHKAVVVFPYSAFSISMVELYELGIPMFVPSQRLVVEHSLMNDAALHPFYASYEKMRELDIPDPDSPHTYSPNSYNKGDMMYWQQFTFFNTRKHIIHWDSIEELMHKLNTTDFKAVSAAMMEETQRFRQEQLDNWRDMLNSLQPR